MSEPNERDKFETKESYSHRESETTTQYFSSRTAKRQAAFLLPHLRAGMRILDCGCGPGTITIGLAEVVAPGEVIGIDINEIQIAQAREDSANRGITNVRFETATAYKLPFPDASFDAAFSNAVLSHLSEPVVALTEIRRLLKPGGVIGIRNPDVDGQVFAPAAPLLERSTQIYAQLVAANGGNAKIGKHHKGLLRQAGFTDVAISATYEVYDSDEAVRHWGQTLAQAWAEEAFVEQLIRNGFASLEEIRDMSRAWQVWSDDSDAFFADAWFSAVGRKL